MHQTALMLIDAFQPEGITRLAKDSIFMMPHLGVLAQVHPKAAMAVFERDCLIYLGTCVASVGAGKTGRTSFEYSITGDTLNESGEMGWGDLKLLALGQDETAEITLNPARGVDVGGGPGKRVQQTVHGGTVGLVLDARGRPLTLGDAPDVEAWVNALDLYPQMAAMV
jgi:hypothetical protein